MVRAACHHKAQDQEVEEKEEEVMAQRADARKMKEARQRTKPLILLVLDDGWLTIDEVCTRLEDAGHPLSRKHVWRCLTEMHQDDELVKTQLGGRGEGPIRDAYALPSHYDGVVGDIFDETDMVADEPSKPVEIPDVPNADDIYG